MFCAGLLLSIADLLGCELRSFQPASPQALLDRLKSTACSSKPSRGYRNKGGQPRCRQLNWQIAAADNCQYNTAIRYAFQPGTYLTPIVVDSSRNEEQTFLDSRSVGVHPSLRECLWVSNRSQP